MIAPITWVSAITMIQMSFVPLRYIESSGTRMQSTSAKIHGAIPPIQRRPNAPMNSHSV
jgi:hypothetical protein